MNRMTISRDVLIREVKILAIFFLASAIQTPLMCRGCTVFRSYILVFAFTFVLWILLWRGNAILTDYVSTKVSWLDNPGKRFVTGLVTTVVYTFLAVLLVIFFFQQVFGFNFGNNYRFTLIFSVAITLLISLFLHCREFLSFWRKASFDAVRFQRESIAARYEALKNQVNPAFLFHSLNTLSGLVYNDEEKAVRYIKALADVYRYVLDTREKEIVPVSDEVAFLCSYAYLLRMRYGIELQIPAEGEYSAEFIPPAVFHMIIENLLPHDAASGVFPSRFTVAGGEGVMELTFPRAFSAPTEKTFPDFIERIRNRYKFLTDKEVVMRNDGGVIHITLPLIEM